MKFLMTYASTAKGPPTPEQMAAIGKFGMEMTQAGVLLMTGGLQRPSKETHIQYDGRRYTVLDGPYAETKELIDGFALIQAKSRDEAVELAKQFMKLAGEGTGEVLQVYDPGEGPA